MTSHLFPSLTLIKLTLIKPSTCVISAIRLWSLLRFQQSDATFSTIPSALLSQFEPSLLITLGCVPLLRPLLGRQYSSRGTARYINSRSTAVATPAFSSNKESSRGSGFKKLTDGSLLRTEHDSRTTLHRSETTGKRVDRDRHQNFGNGTSVQEQAGSSGEDAIQEERASEGDSIELRTMGITKTIEWRVQEESLREA